MVTKLEAATVARRAGTDVVIADGSEPNALSRIAAGEPLGTRFLALDTPPENRKRWILAGAVATGHVVVDHGAARALLNDGSSLLPAGIVGVEGAFDRGDTVSVYETNGEGRTGTPGGIVPNGGREIARGVARYPSDDLDRIKGFHSDRIVEVLGYSYGAVAIHRNDLIRL